MLCFQCSDTASELRKGIQPAKIIRSADHSTSFGHQGSNWLIHVHLQNGSVCVVCVVQLNAGHK